jgi:ribonuclease Z
MKRFSIAMALVGGMWLVTAVPTAEAAPCLIVTLTGTQSGPPVFNGQAGAGTLVRYGEDTNNCSAMKLQFYAGRGTNMRLSQIGVPPGQLNAIFFTHMHSDHTEGFADIMMLRWHFNSKGSKIDVVCSSDAVSVLGFTNSCRKFAMHIGDAFLQSGEIAQRRSEDNARLAGGPADLTNVITFEPKDDPQVGGRLVT